MGRRERLDHDPAAPAGRLETQAVAAMNGRAGAADPDEQGHHRPIAEQPGAAARVVDHDRRARPGSHLGLRGRRIAAAHRAQPAEREHRDERPRAAPARAR